MGITTAFILSTLAALVIWTFTKHPLRTCYDIVFTWVRGLPFLIALYALLWYRNLRKWMRKKLGRDRKIRKAKVKDVTAIYLLCDTEPFKHDDNPPYDREWIAAMVTKRNFITLVYEQNNIIPGVITGEILACDGMMLWFCSIRKESRGGFVGYQLYKEFEAKCKLRGIKWILAYGFKSSEGALRRLDYRTNEQMYKEFFKSLEPDYIF